MAHPVHHARAHHESHAKAHVKKAGYARGGHVEHSDEHEDREMIDRMVKKDALTGKNHGGKVKGGHSKPRMDRVARRADGGRTHGHKSSSKGVNIIIATGGGEGERQMAFKQGAQVGARMAAPGMGGPPRPPMPPPGAGGPPPGGPPPGAGGPPPGMGGMPPRPPMKRGGRLENRDEWSEKNSHAESPKTDWDTVRKQTHRVTRASGGRAYPIDAGAGGAKARMEKEKKYKRGGRAPHREEGGATNNISGGGAGKSQIDYNTAVQGLGSRPTQSELAILNNAFSGAAGKARGGKVHVREHHRRRAGGRV
jgi:hypothetical protein